MKLKNKLKYIFKSPVSFFLSKKYSQPLVLDDKCTLDYILDKGCSVCRYGDGELNLMRGVGIKFQEFDEELCRRLKEIAVADDKSNVLICIPDIFKSLNAFTKQSRSWWHKYLLCTRGYWYKYFRNAFYGDTNMTRFYVENIDKDRDDYVVRLKKLWQDKRILIVEGKKSRLGMGNDLFMTAAKLKRLLCPSVNAFVRYPEILAAVNKLINTNSFDLVICALGPTATVLCFDIADKIQALDLGHIDIEYEWYLCKAQTKQVIKNKAVTEVVDECGDNVDFEYKTQIIGEIE